MCSLSVVLRALSTTICIWIYSAHLDRRLVLHNQCWAQTRMLPSGEIGVEYVVKRDRKGALAPRKKDGYPKSCLFWGQTRTRRVVPQTVPHRLESSVLSAVG